MDNTDFFSDNEDLSFEAYLAKTHLNHLKTTLSSTKAVLLDYVSDIRKFARNADSSKKSKLGKLKTTFTDRELKEMIAGYLENNKPKKIIINANITGATVEIIVIGVGNNASSSSGVKRQRKQIEHVGYVNSQTISDEEDTSSDVCLSESSYAMSDLGEVITGYICISDSEIATLCADARQLVTAKQLFPAGLQSRLTVSGIFSAAGDAIDVTITLSFTVKTDSDAFKLAIQRKKFYKQPVASEDINELALNNSLTSTYLLHGNKRIQAKGSELNLIASSVFTFISQFYQFLDDF